MKKKTFLIICSPQQANNNKQTNKQQNLIKLFILLSSRNLARVDLLQLVEGVLDPFPSFQGSVNMLVLVLVLLLVLVLVRLLVLELVLM